MASKESFCLGQRREGSVECCMYFIRTLCMGQLTREKVKVKGNSSKLVENANMTDCISNLHKPVKTGFGVFIVDESMIHSMKM